MKKRMIGSLAALVAGFGPAMAQQPAPALLGNGGSPPAAHGLPSGPAPGTPTPAPSVVVGTPSTQGHNGQVVPHVLGGHPANGNCSTGTCLTGTCGNGSVDGCFSACQPACPSDARFWVRGEYLLWWTKDAPSPALVTQGGNGVIGQPGTAVIFGDNADDDNKVRNGGRFTVGGWLDCDNIMGVELSYFFLGSQNRSFEVGGNGTVGSPVVARPFFDTTTRSPNAELVSFPNVLRGTVRVDQENSLQGWAPNLLYNVCCDCCYRVDAILGFRYYELRESLTVTENLETLPGSTVPSGTRFQLSDQFDTRNYFYGGAIGLQGDYRMGCLTVGGMASVAFGSTHQIVNARGTTTITSPGGVPVVNDGGLLALPSNSLRQSRDDFSIIPELGVRLGVQVTDNIRATVGYSFLYWSDVVRPGDQIDTSIDTRQLPRSGQPPLNIGANSPAPRFKTSDFWAQGLTFGLEFRY